MDPDLGDGLPHVRHAHRLRTVGHALGALSVASVLYDNGTGPWAWILLSLTGYVWPHLAWMLSLRAADARRSEARNLAFDSVIGGFWIAVMQFSLLPSAVMVLVLSMDRFGVGGWRLLGRSTLVLAVTAATVSALIGFPVRLQHSMRVTALTVPWLCLYPMLFSATLYALTKRVRRQYHMLERLNRIDALTGLHNRRHWEELVASELARHHRARRPAMLMLIDVDHFKAVNDQHGHAGGDGVLRCLADALKASVRDVDSAARYGGDEFAVLLTEADVATATEVAERIRLVFGELCAGSTSTDACTLSIGLASADRVLVGVEDWVRRADAALYSAKGQGRNRIAVF